MTVRVHSVPCRISAPAEYEDAAFPDASTAWEWREEPLRLAVADGATTASFSREWARLLTEGWGSGTLQWNGEGLSDLADAWRAAVDLDGLAWFAAAKARGGTHAAFVGLELHPEGSWRSISLGDCCLFVVRDDALIESFPATRSAELSGSPTLVGSSLCAGEFARCAQRAEGLWQKGDTFLLMSDALARWFLDAALERKSSPWRLLTLDSSPEAFTRLLGQLRSSGALQPDDVTLVSIVL